MLTLGRQLCLLGFLALALCGSEELSYPAPAGAMRGEESSKPTGKLSYYHEIRPILQANCQGCHQPAKAKGGYVMTNFKGLLAGGETEGTAVVPERPDKSALLKMVTPQNGESRMPKGKAPLAESEVALLKTWIEQGAQDDTPLDAKRHYDAEHPPVYSRPPVVSSLDFSPDGKLLAVAGFHEVLLYENAGEKLVGRLIGLSERIQAVRFSPDGQSLAVAGGDPARLGEIQIWDVSKRKLTVSAPISYDTLYGLSWSPDSKLVSFGCADNTLRAIEAASGKQIVQMGSHSDWVLSTAFSLKGDHILSGGRDMSVKLTEVASQRFVDNVTSITPGALKGGVLALATHPFLEHFVAAGSDGLPRVYRTFREVAREIGDDAQLIADLFPMTGRVFTVRFSLDGKRIACGSALDRSGELLVCSYDYTNDVPRVVREIMGKVPDTRKPEEKQKLEDYKQQGIRELTRTAITNSTIYSLAFAPDGNTVAAAGSDGMIRFLNATNGAILKEFVSVPLSTGTASESRPAWAIGPAKTPDANEPESLPQGARVASLEVQPSQLKLTGRNDYLQLLITAHLESGDTADVTRMVKFNIKPGLVQISPTGLLTPLTNGSSKLMVSLSGKSAEAPLSVTGFGRRYHADFVRDVSPIISRLGCNAGTCHGAKEGKNGFKLSLRGYDPETDVRAFADDLAARRVNLASPDESLMLLKAVAEVPHEGGRRTTVDSKYYQILRQWIANGATLDLKSTRVTKIEVLPQNPVVQKIGARQQIRVVATFTNGITRDVTAEAFIESGNTEIATAGPAGLLTTVRRGEAPVLARYEGNYGATILTVMGDRSGFVWHEPESWGRIDELVAAKWKRMKIEPSELCTDLEFIRRVYLDLIGLPPSPEDIEAFLNDHRETRVKRDEVVAHLIGRPEYVDFWANKWADLLQCNSKFLGTEGAETFRSWIRVEVEKNTPYDKFAREILMASGSTHDNPGANYWKILRTPAEAMENTTHLFLATRFNCNKCHDHPFERWTQDQYYHLAAYFAQVSLKEDAVASEGRKVAGNDVESAKPLFEKVSDAKEGDVTHLRTGKIAAPEFPFTAKYEAKDKATRREQLAAWITCPDNRFFASSYVNRIWGYLTGVGIIEPLDDIRAGNPPRNPALLEYLTREFIDGGFNTRDLIQLICKSRTYQLSIRPNKWNQDDAQNYSHALARRLPAETLYDAVFKVTGSTSHIPGAKPGERATQLSDAATDVGSGLLATLGRPARQSACECERSSDLRLGSVMALLSGATISEAIAEPTNALAKLVQSESDDHKLVNDIFLRVLNRPASEKETEGSLALLSRMEADHARITNELAPLEVKMVPVVADLEQQRQAAIAKSKLDLTNYDEMTRTLRAELDRRRQTEIETKQNELKDYEKLLPAQAAFWETKNNPSDPKTSWVPLEVQDASASGNSKLARESDGSLFASGSKGISDYLILARSLVTNITGVMLEVLPDERLPKFGPGRSDDGNFVLSELELSWATGTNAPDTAARFADAKADYSQNDFPATQAIDGKVYSGRNGWAIGDAPNLQRHIATFKLEDPIVSTNGVTLRFNLQQHYDETRLLGRFRLYLTTSEAPLEFGLPESVVLAARARAGERTPQQAAAILDYYRSIDVEFWKRRQAVAKASEPLPADPKFTELQQALSQAEEPIRLDPAFVQLRQDAVTSAHQLENKRLVMVQDLTWALINSPGFLFNY